MKTTPNNSTISRQASIHPRSQKRRKALKALAIASGGLTLSHWTKPAVKSVVLPAHAQTSIVYSMSCVGTPPNGTIVFLPVIVSALVTITPNPGPGQAVTIEGFCNGVGPDFSDTLFTDAAGQVISTGGPGFCSTGETVMVRFSFGGATTECNWVIGIP